MKKVGTLLPSDGSQAGVETERIRNILRQEEDRLVAEIAMEAGQQRKMGEDSGEEGPGEIGDDASELEEREKGLGIEGALKTMLTDVRRSLQKLDAGTYGICDQCGQPIGKGRLEAWPQANLCLRCKARREHARGLSPAS